MPLFEIIVHTAPQLHNDYFYSKKFCNCMSLRAGCSIAGMIWLGLNTYLATASFYGDSPLFSSLDHRALIAMGSICVFFALSSLILIYALFLDEKTSLQVAVTLVFVSILLHLIDILASIILFGTQYSTYLTWCVQSAKERVDESVSVHLQSGYINVLYSPSLFPPDSFNCRLLWENEIKFSIALFIVIFIIYLYWFICVLSYYEKISCLYDRNNRLFYHGRPFPV
ncbi:hypothetical protein BDB01DRAFT_80522 [Pilobolus umbonatus]|nr:hypothetical protein BDB01DRAFT_80522 [Pilobolus umbonatus]